MPGDSRILGQAVERYQNIWKSNLCTDAPLSLRPPAGSALVRPPAARLRRKWRLTEQDAQQCAAEIKRFLTFATVSVVKSVITALTSS